jgi:hypothetical protein
LITKQLISIRYAISVSYPYRLISRGQKQPALALARRRLLFSQHKQCVPVVSSPPLPLQPPSRAVVVQSDQVSGPAGTGRPWQRMQKSAEVPTAAHGDKKPGTEHHSSAQQSNSPSHLVHQKCAVAAVAPAGTERVFAADGAVHVPTRQRLVAYGWNGQPGIGAAPL